MRKIPDFQNMSKEQQLAVTCGKGPVMISAGPGSGKTFTIIQRILYLILEMRYEPQKIYVITFTKDAALSMCQRFQEILQETEGADAAADMTGVHFGTFHSFFYQIIRSHPKYKNSTLLNATGKSGLLFHVQKKRGEEPFSPRDQQSFFSDMSFYKNTGTLREGRTESFLSLVDAYDKEKEREGLLDFDDMLTLCKRLLHTEKGLCHMWQEKIDCLLIDEFQDTNAVQFDVVKMLLKEPFNICVVGDDDQAIYGFRGSEPGIMRLFLEEYPMAEHIRLGTNYRCCGKIVEASSRLIEHNKKRIVKALKAGEHNSAGEILVQGFDSYTEMTKFCLQELKAIEEARLSDYAVLFRTNAKLSLFLAELSRHRIPFCTKEQITSIYEHFVVRDIMDYLWAGAGFLQRERLLRILNKPRTHIGREVLLQQEIAWEQVIAFYRTMEMQHPAALQDAIRFKNGLDSLRSLKLSSGIDFIFHYFRYEAYLKQKAHGDTELYEEWLSVLEFLRQDAKGFQDVAEWERFQQEYNAKAQREKKKVQGRGVHIMTLHGCKGLEFERVFLMQVNEENIPSLKKGEILTEEHLEEERRLFYVGMTRAKKTLDILYVSKTQENPKPPSRFLEELRD